MTWIWVIPGAIVIVLSLVVGIAATIFEHKLKADRERERRRAAFHRATAKTRPAEASLVGERICGFRDPP